jgi:hypothetical protein
LAVIEHIILAVNEHINHRDDFTPVNLYYEVTFGTRKGGHLKKKFHSYEPFYDMVIKRCFCLGLFNEILMPLWLVYLQVH